jgi:hypothetical protein
MMRGRRHTIAMLALLLAAAGPVGGALPEGYQVLHIQRDASPEVVDSARQLADLLERSFGERPRLRRAPMRHFRPAIRIGPAPRHPAFDYNPLTDEVIVERTGNGLSIIGSDNTATRFAVYRFIEEFLGWRAYQPGALGLERLDVPPDPPATRGPPQVLLLEKAGYISRNPSFGRLQAAYDWQAWHGVRERFHYNHTLHRVLPPTRFDTHPDWFAKDADGRPMRPPYYPRVHGYNDHPDLSHPGVRQWVVDHSVAAIASATPFQPARPLSIPGSASPPPVRWSPGAVSLSLSLGDSFVFGHFDDAYPWRPASYFRRWPDWSNHVFAYTNAVADAVADEWQRGAWNGPRRPDLFLGALAYLNWENLPDFPLHPAVVPYLTFDRSQWYDPQARADDLENVARWGNESGAAFLGTWDYLFGYGFLIPRSMTGIVGDSIPALHQRGVRAYFSQVAPLWPYDGHTNWLTTRLLWNPQLDPQALLAEYFAEYFGPAAAPMERFFALAERTWMDQGGAGWWLRHWKDPWQAGLLDEAALTGLAARLEEAAALAEAAAGPAGHGLDPARFAERVERVRMLFALTRALHDYQWTTWRLQAVDWEAAPASTLRAGVADARQALQARARLVAARDAAVAGDPLLGYARDLEWVFLYDSLGASMAAIARRLHALPAMPQSVRAELAALLGEWASIMGLGDISPLDGPWPAVLHDTRFAAADDPRIWHRQFMDAQGWATGKAGGGAGFFAENVRRGHTYQLFRAVPDGWYHGWVDVEAEQSLSGEVYIRLDFFDADHRLLAESRRSRIAPVTAFGPRQRLRALARAPGGAAYGRLFIRFYEMDPGSRAVLKEAGVVRLPAAANP